MGEYGCNVCNEEYSTSVEAKFPRVLTGCGHTICHGCASSIAISGRPTIVCPFDRIHTNLPEGVVRSLKKNFALLELMEKIAESSEQRNALEKGDKYAKERLLSVECDEDNRHVAVLYCTVCDSNLCERCSEGTHSTNVLSKHRRIPLSEKPSPKVHCRLHSSYVVEFVCKEPDCDCENRLMCLMCRDYGRHKGHAHILIELEADVLRKQLEEHIAELRVRLESVDAALVGIKHAIEDISPGRSDGSLVETRQEVRAHFRRLKAELEQDEVAAIEKLESYSREKVEALNTHKDRLESVSLKLGDACGQLQKSITLEKNRLLDREDDLLALAESMNAEPLNFPDETQLSTRIAFSISRDNRLHIGSFIDVRVVFLGLDGSGKTSIVRRLRRIPADSMLPPHPTVGFNVETIHYKNFRLNIWDVGGLPRLRHLWKHYYLNAQALTFVIDGHAAERFSEATKELFKVIADPLVGTCPVLVVINRKQDTPIDGQFDALLSTLSSTSFPLQIHQCDIETGVGLPRIIDSISSSLSRIHDYSM